MAVVSGFRDQCTNEINPGCFLIIIWFHWCGTCWGHLEHDGGYDYTTLSYLQALVLFTLLTEGVDLERLGDGGVFSILDTISEALTRLDLAGENCLLHFCQVYMVTKSKL